MRMFQPLRLQKHAHAIFCSCTEKLNLSSSREYQKLGLKQKYVYPCFTITKRHFTFDAFINVIFIKRAWVYSGTGPYKGFYIIIIAILLSKTKNNKRTNGPVNAHLRSAAYTNKHVCILWYLTPVRAGADEALGPFSFFHNN